MPEFHPFLMKRMMSKFEQDVEYNLSESGVHPVSLGELLADDPGYIDHLLATDLNYLYVNGIPELRENKEFHLREELGSNSRVDYGAQGLVSRAVRQLEG